MKRLFFLALFVMTATAALAQASFPDIPLRGQITPEHRTYLGVGDGAFTVADVAAEVVVAQAYSMYCPICQRDAEHVNEAYRIIQEKGLGDRVKFVGVGVGNTAFEVVFYGRKYAVPFPLFMDEDFAVNEALNIEGTPTFYVLKQGATGLVVVEEHKGELKDPNVLVGMIMDAAGVKEGAS